MPVLDLVRFERYAEGRCAEILRIGSYDDAGPVLERLHEDFLPANGLVPTGLHHEIYLSDPRRTEPARLRTTCVNPRRRSDDRGRSAPVDPCSSSPEPAGP